MTGFESWVPMAVIGSMMPFVKASPQQLLKVMLHTWLTPEPKQKTADDQFGEAFVFAKAHGANVNRVPLDDPFWARQGIFPEDYR